MSSRTRHGRAVPHAARPPVPQRPPGGGARGPGLRASAVLAVALLAAGCATRSGDVKPVPATPADFAGWECPRIHDELDRLQRRAADVAYAVDERAGNNIIALGIGVTVFWPALLAMQPDGPEAQELAQLKGRDEALRTAARDKRCPPPDPQMPAERAAALPVAVGDRLIYEERVSPRKPLREIVLEVAALRRDEIDFSVAPAGVPRRVLVQDLSGNAAGSGPFGVVHWRRLLRPGMELGQVVAGELVAADDASARARVRGQVVAVGPQTIADRRFDVAVIELFGDVARAESTTRLDGVLAVDRASGVLLRLDLRSADADFSLRRTLLRIDAAAR